MQASLHNLAIALRGRGGSTDIHRRCCEDADVPTPGRQYAHTSLAIDGEIRNMENDLHNQAGNNIYRKGVPNLQVLTKDMKQTCRGKCMAG